MSIDYTLHAHIATITINRPETRNSLDMEHFRDLAYDYAGRIAANAPLAVSATEQSAVEGLALDLESAYDNESRHTDRIFATEDAKEGPRAFAEKRPPRWQAR